MEAEAGSESAKIPPLALPHRREEWREERNWFCYLSEKSELGEHKHKEMRARRRRLERC